MITQTSLFGPLPYLPTKGRIATPPAILTALEAGAALAISISGGKDSQALLAELVPWFRSQGYTGQLFAIHADLGNQRLSCALCVFGSENDLLNGAHAAPELYAHFIELEIIGQATFRDGWSLKQLPVTGKAAELRDAVLAGNLTTL